MQGCHDNGFSLCDYRGQKNSQQQYYRNIYLTKKNAISEIYLQLCVFCLLGYFIITYSYFQSQFQHVIVFLDTVNLEFTPFSSLLTRHLSGKNDKILKFVPKKSQKFQNKRIGEEQNNLTPMSDLWSHFIFRWFKLFCSGWV